MSPQRKALSNNNNNKKKQLALLINELKLEKLLAPFFLGNAFVSSKVYLKPEYCIFSWILLCLDTSCFLLVVYATDLRSQDHILDRGVLITSFTTILLSKALNCIGAQVHFVFSLSFYFILFLP